MELELGGTGTELEPGGTGTEPAQPKPWPSLDIPTLNPPYIDSVSTLYALYTIAIFFINLVVYLILYKLCNVILKSY